MFNCGRWPALVKDGLIPIKQADVTLGLEALGRGCYNSIECVGSASPKLVYCTVRRHCYSVCEGSEREKQLEKTVSPLSARVDRNDYETV